MIVLGFSWPIMDKNSVAVILDGKLVFASGETRHTKASYALQEPPLYALKAAFGYLEKKHGIKPHEITDFAIDKDRTKFKFCKVPDFQRSVLPLYDARLARADASFNKPSELAGFARSALTNPDAGLARLFILRAYRALGFARPGNIRIHPVEHQLAHAASAYYFSGANSSAVVVSDSYGEIEHTTIWKVKDGEFEKLMGMPITSGSAGVLWGKLGKYVLNLESWELTDLAAWGGGCRDEGMRRRFDSLVAADGRWPYVIAGGQRSSFFHPVKFTDNPSYAPLLKGLLKGKDLRWAYKGELNKDVAAAAWCGQEILEKSMLMLSSWAKEKTSEKKLGLAGVSFMNTLVNTKIRDSGAFDEVFVFPATDNSGSPAGAAAYVYEHVLGGRIQRCRLDDVYLGPEYDSESVRKMVERGGWKVSADGIEGAAELVSKGKVVAWYQGRSEYGIWPLGNRSVFIDATSEEARRRLNSAKGMWWWRSLSASVLKEDLAMYFSDPIPDPLMTARLELNSEGSSRLLAVRQPGDLVQVQSVTKRTNPKLYELLRSVRDLHGIAAVGNASFSLPRRPMAETPEDAITNFGLGGFDAMYIDGLLISKG
ncbi:Uncharacterised protein [uncultured archaeon]|nr:Uncharacterised protein [uncultured archaeon]